MKQSIEVMHGKKCKRAEIHFTSLDSRSETKPGFETYENLSTNQPSNSLIYVVSPGILLRVLEGFGDESKVLAHLQPQVRLG